jgi:hypothetical protein
LVVVVVSRVPPTRSPHDATPWLHSHTPRLFNNLTSPPATTSLTRLLSLSLSLLSYHPSSPPPLPLLRGRLVTPLPQPSAAARWQAVRDIQPVGKKRGRSRRRVPGAIEVSTCNRRAPAAKDRVWLMDLL